MLAKIKIDPGQLSPSAAEDLADILFEIGTSQSRKSHWSQATFWLERAHNAISCQDMQALSANAGELRMGILHGIARALIHNDNEGSRAKAWDTIHQMGAESSDRLVVLLLKLDVMGLDPAHASQEYCDILQIVVRTVHLTDMNFKTILYHVHKLRTRSAPMAHVILVTLLEQRLLGAEKPKWLEKAFVTLIWNFTTSTQCSNDLRSLSELLDTFQSSLHQTLSSSATYAVQIVRLS